MVSLVITLVDSFWIVQMDKHPLILSTVHPDLYLFLCPLSEYCIDGGNFCTDHETCSSGNHVECKNVSKNINHGFQQELPRFVDSFNDLTITGYEMADPPSFGISRLTPRQASLMKLSGGILGISGKSSSCRSTTFFANTILTNQKYLKIHPPTKAKTGILEVFQELPKGNFEWSVQKEANLPNSSMISFHVYDISLPCTATDPKTISQNWIAVIDSSVTCLVLPSQLYRIINSWMDMNSAEKQLHLNLKISPESKSVEVIAPCYTEGKGTFIKLGTSVEIVGLVSYLVEVRSNGEYGRVGFESLHEEGIQSSNQCNEPIQCIKDQSLASDGSNFCVVPDCSQYFLKYLSDGKGTCEYSWSLPNAVMTLVGTLFVLEILSKRFLSSSCSIALNHNR
jgi:hypothetical protein